MNRSLLAFPRPLIESDHVKEFCVTDAPVIEIRDGLLRVALSSPRNGADVVCVRLVVPVPRAYAIRKAVGEHLAEHGARIREVN